MSKDIERDSAEKTDVKAKVSSLRTTSDGVDILSPQPSDDENDPLNWSQSKKKLILLIVSAIAFLPDFGASLGAVTSVVQSNLLYAFPPYTPYRAVKVSVC